MTSLLSTSIANNQFRPFRDGTYVQLALLLVGFLSLLASQIRVGSWSLLCFRIANNQGNPVGGQRSKGVVVERVHSTKRTETQPEECRMLGDDIEGAQGCFDNCASQAPGKEVGNRDPLPLLLANCCRGRHCLQPCAR